MINRSRKFVIVAVTALALVGAASVEPALAKKNKIVATVNGKRVKWKGRYVSASVSGVGTIIIAAKPGRTVRTVGFGCPIDPRNETFPLTPPPDYCNANYIESRGAAFKSWLEVNGANVTYDSFDGTRLTGSFSVQLQGVSPNGLPPVTIEGTFDIAITTE